MYSDEPSEDMMGDPEYDQEDEIMVEELITNQLVM